MQVNIGGRTESIVYKRAPRPLIFPEHAEMPESRRHLHLRTFLFDVLRYNFGDRCGLGCDQFVYFRASDPRRCLAPDVFARTGMADDPTVRSWKTWERGAPQLAVEIVSENENDLSWEEKLARYHELGVEELVHFDPSEPIGKRIRVWDRRNEDLVERVLDDDATPCRTLGGSWFVGESPHEPVALRLADESGKPWLAEVEAKSAEVEAKSAEVEAKSAEVEAQAARIRELEALLEAAK